MAASPPLKKKLSSSASSAVKYLLAFDRGGAVSEAFAHAVNHTDSRIRVHLSAFIILPAIAEPSP